MDAKRAEAKVDLASDRAGRKPLLVVHIGAGKTGSSSIQTFLGRNRSALAAQGVLVPNEQMEFGRGSGQQVFYFLGLRDLPDAAAKLKSKIDETVARFGRKRLKAVIVSAENLSNAHGLHEAFGLLRQEFELCVVFYIRRQEDYYLSAWQQWFSKTGRSRAQWVRKPKAGFGDWAAAIDRWSTIEPDHFIVRVFERARMQGGDVVTDFCTLLGLDPARLEREEKPTNESFGVHVSSLYEDIAPFFLNAHDRRIEQLFYDFDIHAARKYPDETLFSPEDLEFIRAKHAEGNRRIKERFFPELDGESPFGPMDHDRLRRVDQSEINRRNIAVLAEVMFKHIIQSRERNPLTDQFVAALSRFSNPADEGHVPQRGWMPPAPTEAQPSPPPLAERRPLDRLRGRIAALFARKR